MKNCILHTMISCALLGGVVTPATAQLQSKINLTLEQQVQIEQLTKVYEQQGLDIKQAVMKAEKEVAPEAVGLRVGNGGWLPGPSVRADLNPWPTTYAGWLASATFPGSIQVDRDAYIHTFTPSQLVKKVLLKAYTPQDEARIQNVRFLGFNGIAGGGDAWADATTPNPALVAYSTDNRGLAHFTKGTSNFDIDKGLILSTGHTWGHEGPNESTNAISEGVDASGWNTAGLVNFDPDLTTIAGQPTRLGGILEFDFSPAVDKASFDYVFGSEEYPEFVHSSFNDVFGFFVSGPYDSPSGSATVSLPGLNAKGRGVYNGDPINTYNHFNIAQLPNGDAVGVDWTNWGYRPSNNTVWDTPYGANTTAPWDTIGTAAAVAANVPWGNLHQTHSTLAFNPEYHRINRDGSAMMELDGITVKLTALMDSLVPGKWYRLKIGIAQVDWQHGDGVFIGNLDLGQATSGIGNNNRWPGWSAANDALGLTNFYVGCTDTLTVDFDPQGFTQYVEIIPKGALAGNLVDMEGNPIQLKDTLPSGQSRIVRVFTVSEEVDFTSGATGWFQTYSYDPATYAGTPTPSNAVAGDTSAVFNVYKRFTTDAKYKRPTTNYAGSLELNIKNGSPNLFRSLNGGLTWENAYLPFSKSQIYNFVPEEDYILLKEPNSCWFSADSVSAGTGGMTILRPVDIPEVSGAITIPVAGRHYIDSRGDFVITIKPTGANAGMIPVLTTSRTTVPDSEGVTRVDNGDGSYTFIIRRVQEPITLSFDFTTGNASIENGSKVWSDNGQLYVTPSEAGVVRIFNAAGTLMKTFNVAESETIQMALGTGLYIVTINDHTYKAFVK